MEFSTKLQELRKKKGLTQEELANILFVSRTAISKWESGRGYPSIDSLKMIAKYFEISIDDLLSGDELIVIAEEDNKIKQNNLCDFIFGLIDVSLILFFFLPLFGQKDGNIIKAVSLSELYEISMYLKIIFIILTIIIISMGVLRLVLMNFNFIFWNKFKNIISVILNVLAVLVFILCRQSYAAFFLLVMSLIKEISLFKLVK